MRLFDLPLAPAPVGPRRRLPARLHPSRRTRVRRRGSRPRWRVPQADQHGPEVSWPSSLADESFFKRDAGLVETGGCPLCNDVLLCVCRAHGSRHKRVDRHAAVSQFRCQGCRHLMEGELGCRISRVERHSGVSSPTAYVKHPPPASLAHWRHDGADQLHRIELGCLELPLPGISRCVEPVVKSRRGARAIDKDIDRASGQYHCSIRRRAPGGPQFLSPSCLSLHSRCGSTTVRIGMSGSAIVIRTCLTPGMDAGRSPMCIIYPS